MKKTQFLATLLVLNAVLAAAVVVLLYLHFTSIPQLGETPPVVSPMTVVARRNPPVLPSPDAADGSLPAKEVAVADVTAAPDQQVSLWMRGTGLAEHRTRIPQPFVPDATDLPSVVSESRSPTPPQLDGSASQAGANPARLVAGFSSLRAAASPAPATAPPEAIRLPAALVEPAAGSNLTQAELDRLQGIRDSFVQAVGGEGQNPNDPGYQQRWLDAQGQVDEQVRAIYGNAFYGSQVAAAERARLAAGLGY